MKSCLSLCSPRAWLKKEMPLNRTISTRAGFLLIAVALLVSIVIKELVSVRRQNRALEEADAHINAIQSSWSEFTTLNPEARLVTLRRHTGPMGSVAASGWIPDRETEERIRTFIEGTGPPNGVKMLTIIDPVRYADAIQPNR